MRLSFPSLPPQLIFSPQTAGLTLAARLSEDPAVSVLVLEAGNANLDDMALRESSLVLLTRVSLMLPSVRSASYGSHFGKPEYTWNHLTVRCIGMYAQASDMNGVTGQAKVDR